ncbi:sulfotransferase domain-containing protein [Thermodesulfovibrionales bacterium]|nr:sulfotransferase domain-containing protein [Thermodesulfovibrionales bacterium]MCL0071175.1 sulfotransferase domain-containing protein [Thermodesulfovibrionales bacterium]MCL0072474.1 sulfotransferase domain-containing protein [Thermodesulfovibrionales bacterium]MCL0085284.1 sulfotransferase domain-containing protein [Thermodesulfovibrionales bacterium]MCL0086901.1 sulfotransferase domain-containing protein [Thermodesulfovibrionales bacterium]
MIKFVMNAFPRTGSTITYWMLKEGEPDAIHLYEPLHDNLFKLINEEGSVMHGGTLWDGYQKVDKKILNEMWLKHKDATTLHRFADCEPYMDAINSIEGDVILQPNRLHFVLKDVAKKYNCKVAHLCRKPADCFLSFAEIFALYAKDLTKNYNWWIANITGFVSFFQTKYHFIAEKFHTPRVTDFLDQWLIVYTYDNYFAAQQADDKDVMMIFFEDIVAGKGADVLEDFSGCKFGGRGMIKPEKVFVANDAFKEEVDARIKALGLSNMVEEMYEIAKLGKL